MAQVASPKSKHDKDCSSKARLLLLESHLLEYPLARNF